MSSDEAQRGGNLNVNQHVSPLDSLELDEPIASNMMPQPVGLQSRPTSHDRNELIEKIKRVKSPLWQLHQDVSSQLS
jgi:hypothetical protein